MSNVTSLIKSVTVHLLALQLFCPFIAQSTVHWGWRRLVYFSSSHFCSRFFPAVVHRSLQFFSPFVVDTVWLEKSLLGCTVKKKLAKKILCFSTRRSLSVSISFSWFSQIRRIFLLAHAMPFSVNARHKKVQIIRETVWNIASEKKKMERRSSISLSLRFFWSFHYFSFLLLKLCYFSSYLASRFHIC